MAIRDQPRDLCGSLNLLGDLSKHFIYDETLHPDIVRPVLESKDNFSTTPESFNMHVLFNQIQNVLDVNPTKQNVTRPSSFDNSQHFPAQLSPLLSHQIQKTPIVMHTHSTYFDYKLAKDIISSAQYITDSDQNPTNNIWDKKNNADVRVSHNKDNAVPTYIKGESNYEVENNFWADLQLRWESLAKTDLESHPWLVNHEEDERELNYQFSVQNTSTREDLMKHGIELLSQGHLTLAIATFEAELQARPENSKAWLYLGSSHAENEQDEFSISALRKCITLDPKNMDARLLLAVGYANESKNRQACIILREWLLNHPCFYSLFPSEDLNGTNEPYLPSFLDEKFYQEVSKLFEFALSSALGNPQEIGDLHVATGILHHLAEQYSRSVKHFKTALSLQTDNPMLWNKLGATLANGDRSEEAAHAYKEALKLYPNYVRCRYNMGIACMNLKSFPEACEHFLIALKLQSQGRGPSATAWNLWSTLRLALMLGDMPHLFPAVDNRDLDSLLVEFHLCD